MPLNVKLVIGMISATFVASLAVALIPASQSFDECYDDAMPEQADWKLVVDYSVAGQLERRQYEAYYRRRARPRFQENSWSFHDESTAWVEEFECGMNDFGLYISSCGPTGGCSESTLIQPFSTTEGVRLSMDLERIGGKQPYQASATIDIPFRRKVSGNSGKFAYQATWQRVAGGK